VPVGGFVTGSKELRDFLLGDLRFVGPLRQSFVNPPGLVEPPHLVLEVTEAPTVRSI
jgi:hypothetical protein